LETWIRRYTTGRFFISWDEKHNARCVYPEKEKRRAMVVFLGNGILRHKVPFIILMSMIVAVPFWGCDKDKQAEDIPDKIGKLETITGKDGASMVLIPAGEFQMGTDPSEIPALVQRYEQLSVVALDFENEIPRRTVYVDDFYMDIYEVTNAQYKKFIDATGHGAPMYWDDSRYNAPNQPVIGIFWYEVVAYA
jgi:formylglycine-generating enzyme required for sulfatase activity